MSIRAKLFLLFFFALVAFGGVLHLYWLPHYLELEEGHTRREQTAYLELLGTSLVPALLSRDLAQIHHTLDHVLRERPMWFGLKLVNPQGAALYPLSEQPLATSQPLSEILVAISDDQGIVGWLSADVNMKAIVAERTAEIVKLESVLLAVLALTAVFGAWFADRWVRRPITALASAAGRITQGDYSAPLGNSARDEVGDLTKAFERMRAIVQRREADISAQNRTLSAIRDAQTRFIREADFQSVLQPLLTEAKVSSCSRAGLIAEVVDDANGYRYLHALRVATPTSEQADPDDLVESMVLPLEAGDEVLTRVVDGNQTLLLTELPQATSLRQVCPGTHQVVAMPLRAMGTVIGMLLLAGRTQRYTESDVEVLRPVTSTCANLLNAMQGERDRLAAVERVRETASRMSAIFNTMVDGVITIGHTGIIESINPAVERIFGYGSDELIGQNVNILMPEPYRSAHDSYLHNHLTTGERKVIGAGREVEGLRKNGETFPLELGVSEIDVGGRQLFTGVVRDVTERKRVDRMKSEFISTVSHELRTPLTAIRGALGLIAGAKLGEIPGSVLELAQLADKNAERLVRLINDILDIEKMEAGKMQFHFADHDLVTVIEQAIAANQSYASQYEVNLRCGDMPARALASADADRIRQVLDNLISNAVKFSPPQGEVRVGLGVAGDRFVLSVIDQGPGIPEEFQPRLFQKFSQSDSSDSRARGGTGLGLSICQAIVEHHRGDIRVDSGEEGGTTVYVSLPASSSHSDADTQHAADGCPVARLHHM